MNAAPSSMLVVVQPPREPKPDDDRVVLMAELRRMQALVNDLTEQLVIARNAPVDIAGIVRQELAAAGVSQGGRGSGTETTENTKPKQKKSKRRLPNFLTQGEEADLLATCAKQAALVTRRNGRPRAASGILAARRDEVIVLVGLRMGLRVSEIKNLDIEHLDFESRMCLVFQGKGSRDRMVPITEDLIKPLRKWIGDRKSGAVFQSRRGVRMAVSTIEFRMCRLGKLAGLKKKLKPHSLRHSVAVRWLETGANIAEVRDMLGHSSISISDVYLHTVPERLRAAANRAAQATQAPPVAQAEPPEEADPLAALLDLCSWL
jgi:integrase